MIGMRLKEEDIDRYVLGYLSFDFTINEEIDRSIIHIPNSKCVIIYNKYQEDKLYKEKNTYKKRKLLTSTISNYSRIKHLLI